MSRRESRGKKQRQLDRSFQDLSISSQQTHPEMLQSQQYYPKKTSSHRKHHTDGGTYGGQRWPKSDRNHRDNGHHEPYQCGAMPSPRAPVPIESDDYSDSGASEVSARREIPPGHQPHANPSHMGMKHFRGAPSDRASIYGREGAARNPSVAPFGAAPASNAPPGYFEVENAPPSYCKVGDGRSKAEFDYAMAPEKGIPAPRAYGSEYERSKCNEFDPDCVAKPDSGPYCTEPGVSVNDTYTAFWDGYWDGYDRGLHDGLHKAMNPGGDDLAHSKQRRLHGASY